MKIGNHNHHWLSKLDILVSVITLILCPLSFIGLFFCRSVWTKTLEWLGDLKISSLKNWVQLKNFFENILATQVYWNNENENMKPKHYLISKLDFLVSSTMLILCPLFGSFRRAASFVERFIFLSDKIILNQEVINILKDQVISVLLSNFVWITYVTWITLLIKLCGCYLTE